MSTRLIFLLGVAACATLVGAALALQHVMGLEPCPLCILQRIVIIAIAVPLLIGALHNPGRLGRRIYAGTTLVLAIAGAGLAGRHLWLQHLPPEQVPSCGPGLDYILETFPPGEALSLILQGSGECATVAWTFMGLSIPGWTLIAFFGFAALGILLLLYDPASPAHGSRARGP